MSEKSAANSSLLTDLFPYPKFWWFLSNFIPFRRLRRKFQFEVLADWKFKYNELLEIYPNLRNQKFKVDATGGFVIGFYFPKQDLFISVHKSPIRVQSFDKEKAICDKLIKSGLFPKIEIPKIEVIKSRHFTYSVSQYVKGKSMKRFPKKLQNKFAFVMAEDLAYIIYHLTNDIGILHSDMCGNNVRIDYKTGHVVGIIDWRNTIEVEGLESIIHSNFLDMFEYLTTNVQMLIKMNLLSYMITDYQKKHNKKQDLMV